MLRYLCFSCKLSIKHLQRYRRFQFLTVVTIGVVLFCNPDSHIVPAEQIDISGMVLLHSKNVTIKLGSIQKSAQLDEQPVTYNTFTYDFYIDTCEVTIDSYRSIMGMLPSEYSSLGVADSSLPVTYVSWYDAVLYCNKRSKQEDRDTVYAYIAIERTSAGDIYRFTGIETNYEKNGYRLPTEAEWIFAAQANSEAEYFWGNTSSQDTAAQMCWYVANSNGVLHPTGTRTPNMHTLYDLVGNATEWISDTKTTLPGGDVSDFVGGRVNSTTARILKGGSFNHDLMYLRTACRSDQYPVDAASKNRYTGFRCVAGAIEIPTFFNGNNPIDTLEPVFLAAKSLLPFVGTNKVKLAFVNSSDVHTRTLCYVDYSESSPQVCQFTNPTEVYTPTISPDGKWVAWATRDEGNFGTGTVYIRRLLIDDTAFIALPDTPAFVPRWYVDSASADTFVLYVTSAQLNDLATWQSTQTKMMQFAEGGFTGSPIIVEAHGAYHGGRSSDGNYLATGYPYLKMKQLSTQEEKTLFYAPLNGKTSGDTSQVCNVSITPESSGDQVLFLDFGSGRDTSTLTHTAYHSHEYLFRCDYSGAVLSWYRVPEPYYAWNYSEWSTHGDFAVSAATTMDGACRSLFCINLKNESVERLCDGTNLYHPHLWIERRGDTSHTDLAIDSLGYYDDPHLTNSQALLAYKMRLFWHLNDSIDMVFVGSSTAANGIDPRYFTGVHGLNMAVGAGDLATTLLLINDYILNHCPKIKIIGMSFDMNYFFVDGGYIELYPAFTQGKGFMYDKNNQFWKDGLPPLFRFYINSVPEPACGPPPSSIDSLGLIRFACVGWGSEPLPCNFDPAANVFNDIYTTNMQKFLETLEVCFTKGIKVLMVVFPTNPGYKDINAYGPMGPTGEVYKIMVDQMNEYAEDHPNLLLYDANAVEVYDYSSNEFRDFGHLCEKGAARLSSKIDTILHSMMDE